MENLTLEKFLQIPFREVIARGVATDDENGINITGSGNMLKWIAVKGGYHDWCIYVHWAENDWNFIRSQGDKVCGKENILKTVPCDVEVFERYRY